MDRCSYERYGRSHAKLTFEDGENSRFDGDIRHTARERTKREARDTFIITKSCMRRDSWTPSNYLLQGSADCDVKKWLR